MKVTEHVVHYVTSSHCQKTRLPRAFLRWDEAREGKEGFFPKSGVYLVQEKKMTAPQGPLGLEGSWFQANEPSPFRLGHSGATRAECYPRSHAHLYPRKGCGWNRASQFLTTTAVSG